MLFNSYVFVFGYLPVVFAGFFGIARLLGPRVAAGWLAIASLAFYAAWNPHFVLLLLASIAFNFAVAKGIARDTASRGAGRLLAFGIVADLALLAVFKYANFFLDSVNAMTGSGFGALDIVLPLGISFFTFTQIAFLVDVRRGLARDFRADHYTLFVNWFPHLIAGPVIHHAQVMFQFDRPRTYRIQLRDVGLGLSVFALGLGKKVLLADTFGEIATPVFDAAAAGRLLGAVVVWSGAVAYALQLYFDFSGYSDMACGLSRMFGVRLPLNFHSPYKAWNIIEFWRRWHITLSNFLRDYLYIPLGGNRHGAGRRYLNLVVTMLLGGLWHGANWTFVLWGAAHGLFLLVNHAFHAVRKRRGWGGAGASTGFGRALGTALTLTVVVLAWIPFRADDVHTAVRMLVAAFDWRAAAAGPGLLATVSDWPQQAWVRLLSGQPLTLDQIAAFAAWPTLFAGLVIVLFAPNVGELGGRRSAFGVPRGRSGIVRGLRWRPNAAWAWVTGLLLAVCLVNLDRVSPFLYFQF